MKKSVVQEKSRGVLLFAFNTNQTDYVKIAERASRLISHTLELPVTIISDRDITNSLINSKPGKGTAWRNGDRYRAYELSPYDETLLLDSDYLMLDNNLLKLFEQSYDYRIMTHNQSQTGAWSEQMGAYSFPYQWATAILFKKTNKSKMLFDLVGRIQRNYNYYCHLYQISQSNFRNDYAFTIADNLLNGYNQTLDQGIPWPMLTFNEVVESLTLKNNMIVIKEKNRAYLIPRQNIHIMDKDYLLSDNFENFVNSICVN
jgi:hypothetical protein